MGYTADWKSAKKAFEDATKKKKPSATFMGVFNKGSGIEAALKSADAAKTADDLKKAIEKFSVAVKSYLTTLAKTAGDPKSVPAADKPAYVTAIGKLTKDLEAISDNATGVAAKLASSNKKDKVEPSKLQEKEAAEQKKLQEAAEKHYQLRLDAVTEAKKVVKNFEAALKQAEAIAANARKARDKAAEEKRSGNRLGATVQADVIGRFLDQAEAIVKNAEAHYQKNVQDTSSTIKQSRSDFKDLDKLAEFYRKPYNAKSVKAFGEGTTIAGTINSLLGELRGARDEVEGLGNEAEALADKTQRPEVYVARLDKAYAALNKLVEGIKLSHTKLEGMLRDIKGHSLAPTQLSSQIVVWAERINKFESDLPKQTKAGDALKAQATTLPRGATEDDGVNKSAKKLYAKGAEMDQLAPVFTKTIRDARTALKEQVAELKSKTKQAA